MPDERERDEYEERDDGRESRKRARDWDSWVRRMERGHNDLARSHTALEGRVNSIERLLAVSTAMDEKMSELVARHEVTLQGEGESAGLRTEVIMIRRLYDKRQTQFAILWGVVGSLAVGVLLLLVERVIK